MAVGILSIGMMLVATMFPLAMHLTAVATERTIASIVADQAFAKIQLYSVDISQFTSSTKCVDFNDVSYYLIDPNEFAYPAMEPSGSGRKQYYWSALCRKINNNSSDRTVQVIVFVSRKRGAGLTYQGFDQPVPVQINVSQGTNDNELNITTANDERLINSGSVIVDNATGQIYRVIERDEAGSGVVTLDREWDYNTPAPDKIWIIAPPDSGGANPAIAVFQEIIEF